MADELSVIPDLIKSSMGVGANDHYATRIYHVAVLKGDADKRLYAAIHADGIPVRGDAHPVSEITLPVDDVRAQALSTDIFEVVVTYRHPLAGSLSPEVGQPAEISVTTTLQEVETEFDASGHQIYTKHVPGADWVTGRVAVQIPIVTVNYSIRLNAADVLDPRNYIGKTNSNEGYEGGASSWLCTRFDKHTTDSGHTYMVYYAFHWKPKYTLTDTQDVVIIADVPGWYAVVVEYDDNTGRPVKDPVLGEGLMLYQVYEEVSFDPLNLTF